MDYCRKPFPGDIGKLVEWIWSKSIADDLFVESRLPFLRTGSLFFFPQSGTVRRFFLRFTARGCAPFYVLTGFLFFNKILHGKDWTTL